MNDTLQLWLDKLFVSMFYPDVISAKESVFEECGSLMMAAWSSAETFLLHLL